MALVTVTDFIREILTYQKLNSRFNVLKNFINEQCVHQDETATNVVGNKIIKRDANGTAKVAAPVEADDIARKAEVDAVAQSVADLESDIEGGTVVAGAAKGDVRYQVSGGRTLPAETIIIKSGLYSNVGVLYRPIPAGKVVRLKRVACWMAGAGQKTLALRSGTNVLWESPTTLPLEATPNAIINSVVINISVHNIGENDATVNEGGWWFDFAIEDA